jgi:hypothetical protein
MRVTDDLPWIYGAALAAAGSEAVACDVTEDVLLDAPPEASRKDLVTEAVRLAVRRTEIAPFDGLPAGDREALALVRLAGLTVTEVSAATGEEPDVVKRRLGTALRSIAGLPEVARRERRGLGAIAHPQLLKHVPNVGFDGCFGDHESLGDLAVS